MKKKSGIHLFIYKYFYSFFEKYITNNIINQIPIWTFRKCWYKLMGLTIGLNSHVDMNSYFIAPRHIRIGANTHINQSCFLDGRGEITIKDNVSISHYVKICTGSHSSNSPTFEEAHGEIIIEEYAWIGIGAIILKNVILGEGCIVAAGSVVTNNVAPYTIVAGSPAKKIGNRKNGLIYHPLSKEHHFRYL